MVEIWQYNTVPEPDGIQSDTYTNNKSSLIQRARPYTWETAIWTNVEKDYFVCILLWNCVLWTTYDIWIGES